MLKYLLGRKAVSRAKTWSPAGQREAVEEVDWQDNSLEGKLDLVVTLLDSSVEHLSVQHLIL